MTPGPGSAAPLAAALPVDPDAPEPVDGGGSLVDVAMDGVSVLVHWLVVLVLVFQAVALALRPPGGEAAVGAWAGLVCLLWAIFCLGMGVLRGTRPDGRDLAPPIWLSVVTSGGCLLCLAAVREVSGQLGPWPAQVVVGGLLVASLTVWRGPVLGGLGGGVLALALVANSLVGRPPGALLRTPAAGAVPGLALLATALAVALALGVLLRSAAQLQRFVDDRDEALVRERAVRAVSEVAAEVERSLHDTALNTLETIAAHGDLLEPAAVVERCRCDAAQLARWRSGLALADLDDVVAALGAHAGRVGLSVGVVDLREDGGPPVPDVVLRALLGAGTEALTNVSKHAGVQHARILVASDPSGLRLVVSDEGIGHSRPADGPDGGWESGFGLAHCVLQRMRAAGGTARIADGPAGRGTWLVLEWHPPLEEPPTLVSDMLLRTAGVGMLITGLLALAACALVVVGWDAYAHPWLAVGSAVIPALVGSAILTAAWRDAWVGTALVAAACATYALAGALALLADPYCSSLLGEGVMLDPRAPMLAAVLVLAPRSRVLVAMVGTVLGVHVLGAAAWHLRWAPCGGATMVEAALVVALLCATWLFVLRIRQVSARVAHARVQAMAAQVRIAAQLGVRAEEEHWVADTLASAQAALADIADGRLSPADRRTQALCADEAAFLRGLLAVGRAPDRFRRPARIWLRLLHAAGCRTFVRGSFDGFAPSPGTVFEVGGFIDVLCTYAPGSEVALFGWNDAQSAGLSVTARSRGIEQTGEALVRQLARVAPGAWRDVEGDSAAAQWQWGAAEVPASRTGG